MAGLTGVSKAVKATGEEILGLLVDDWVLFFGIVGALAAAGVVAESVTGNKLAAGLLLFAGIWLGLFASLARSVRDHRKKLVEAAAARPALNADRVG